ncbi:16S rRNA (guanine(527)-N(7))-methyltransferase RsmG [Bordetella genomosp. 13]|uniref:16S rRNA (guanine(527)-N(7))-methyltransferase RsmG n=1 Tax=Bordetella genomosp. 13 TaxID=463040 RepID=UPI00119FCC37|nr:16S rRNA (guanine(527)-N(7))-methyltransferase RsmG [Bordetella genomosp. 13]
MSPADTISADASSRLTAACQQLGLDPQPRQRDTLLRYVAQLQRWNRTYNLTAIRDGEQMLVHHVFDSLAVVPPLASILGEQATIMDVGSGGGLPGAVLAALQPGWQVTCVDAVDKKMAFVRQMSGALGLPNLQARHARIESLDPAGCDMVVSRAFASLEDFAAWSGRHVKEGGDLVAMKGKIPDAEIDALHQHGVWHVQRIEPLVVPELDAQRCLIWMRRR